MIYDIILASLVLVSVFVGIRKGAAKTILSCAAILLAIIISLGVSKPAADFVFDSFVRNSVEDEVSSAIVTQVNSTAESAAELHSPVDDAYVSAMDYFGESEKAKNKCTQMISEKGREAASDIVNVYRPVIVGFISLIIAIVLFLILAIVFILLAKLIATVFKLPLVNFVDKTAGAFLGLIRGFVIILMLAMILKLLAPVVPAENFFSGENIGSSAVFSYVYNGGVSKAVQSFMYNFG